MKILFNNCENLFYLQKECHSCNRTHIPVKSVLREIEVSCVTIHETDIASWNLKQKRKLPKKMLKNTPKMFLKQLEFVF